MCLVGLKCSVEKEEDSRLEAAIAEHGYCWSKVAACVPPRTDSQCRRRWIVLFPHEVPLLRAAKNIQKAALISNFVDRESERPALGPNDFIPSRLTNSIPESESVNPSGKQKRKSRRRLESKTKAKSSSDNPKVRSERLIGEAEICSEEVSRLTNCNEVENSGGNDAISKKKRVRKSSSSCPEPTLGDRDSATKKKKAPSGRQKRKSRRKPEPKEFGTTSGNDAISKKRTLVNLFSNENQGSGPTKEQPLSCPDSSILMITNGEEACVSGRANATKNKKASKLHPRKKKCIELPKEVLGITNSDEVDMFGGNYDISKKRRKVTNPHLMKNKGAGRIECHSLSCPDSTMLVFGSGGEGEAFSRGQSRRNLCTQLPEKMTETINSNKVGTFGGDETISEWRKRLSKPHLEQGKCIDQVQDHSSSCPDPTLHKIVGGDDARKKKTAPNRYSRNIYTKLLQEISEINDSVVDEALRENVAFPKKERASKRCLENNAEFEALDGNHATGKKRVPTVKKRVAKPCARNKCTEPSKVSQSLVSLPASLEIRTADADGIKTLTEDDGTLCKKERASNQHPGRIRCAEQSGEQQEQAISSVKAAKSHAKGSGSTELVEGSQSISLAPKCSISKMMDVGNSGASSVCQQAKMSRTRDKTYSNQILERGDGDNTTLSCFLRNKLKKRRIELSENGNGACSTGGSDFAYQGNRSTS